MAFRYNNKSYEVDKQGFLASFNDWDRDFAEGMAPQVQIYGKLTELHWTIIDFIRDTFKEIGKCPLIYQTCRINNLRLGEFKELFPTGYLRGACRLAGLTYREGFLGRAWLAAMANDITATSDTIYEVDVRGFLIDPYAWDENFAVYKAYEMKTEQLTEEHWKIIYFLREHYLNNYNVPTVFETCEANEIDLDELEKLFPDGYHRGAVKLAGLRVR